MTTLVFRFSTLGAAAAVLAVSGCQGVQSAFDDRTEREEVTASVDETAAMVAEVNGRIDEAIRNLQGIVDHPSGDLTRQLDSYTDSLDRLEEAAEDLRDRNEVVQQKGREYLVNWDREIATVRDSDLREQSLERRNEVEERLDTLDGSYIAARDRLTPLLRQLDDMQLALSADLTGAGIESIRASLDDLGSVADPAREALRDFGDELRRAHVALLDRGVPANLRS